MWLQICDNALQAIFKLLMKLEVEQSWETSLLIRLCDVMYPAPDRYVASRLASQQVQLTASHNNSEYFKHEYFSVVLVKCV
jgi:hypothetical protein